jgi:NadR type nicotinamide-nucleotide adenylyltransferase
MEEHLQQQKSDCLKIVIYGPESTGKTTLAKALANEYKTNWVPEFARDYLQDKWDLTGEVCTKEDLIQIVKGQIDAENKLTSTANDFLFCDTNVLVTKVWSETHFKGFCDSRIKQWANSFHYDYYFLTHIDVPWQEDDLRDRPDDREDMFDSFIESLLNKNLPFTILKGTHESRMKQAQKVLKNLLIK